MMTATYAGLTQRKSNRLLSDKPKVRILYPVPGADVKQIKRRRQGGTPISVNKPQCAVGKYLKCHYIHNRRTRLRRMKQDGGTRVIEFV